MKALFLFLFCGAAFATNKLPPVPASNANSHSVSNASAGSATSDNGDSHVYLLPSAGSAAQLPSGMCNKGQSEASGYFWNFYWTSTSSNSSDLDCVKLLVRLEELRREPIPSRPVVYPTVNAPLCTPLARKTQLGLGCSK